MYTWLIKSLHYSKTRAAKTGNTKKLIYMQLLDGDSQERK